MENNYSFTRGLSLPDVPNNYIFERYNFCRKEPHTAIFAGKTGLVFRNCNLVNCDVPADSIIEGGLNIHKSFCTHIHPGWIEKGLTPCVANCYHVTDVDTITIDGQVIDTIYQREDRMVI